MLEIWRSRVGLRRRLWGDRDKGGWLDDEV